MRRRLTTRERILLGIMFWLAIMAGQFGCATDVSEYHVMQTDNADQTYHGQRMEANSRKVDEHRMTNKYYSLQARMRVESKMRGEQRPVFTENLQKTNPIPYIPTDSIPQIFCDLDEQNDASVDLSDVQTDTDMTYTDDHGNWLTGQAAEATASKAKSHLRSIG